MAQKDKVNVSSNLVTIDKIIKSSNIYNIPRYQRLYVWQKDQINTLLFDLYEAHISEKDSFYLGSVLLVRPNEENNIYDLVDGQQRFTTLWLLSLELGGNLEAFTHKPDGEILLKFAIRQDVKEYFKHLLKGNEIPIDENKEGGSLARIKDARKEIQNFINSKFTEKASEKKKFTSFIRNNVQLIETQIPKESDLSKVFEVINNRGVQLQHEDILKSLLLSEINPQEERIQYSKIWNSCANMKDYLDRNLALETGTKNVSHCVADRQCNFIWFRVLDQCKNNQNWGENSKRLDIILKKENKKLLNQEEEYENHPNVSEDEFQRVRSILTFPQLLLHTLRIYLFRNNKPDINKINEKELLQIFKTHFIESINVKSKRKEEVKNFIKLLWQVREAFDKNIVKWVEIEPNNEVLILKKIEAKNKFTRSPKWYIVHELDNSPENKGKELLQSMLYHSQQNATQYWLTPFLNKILNDRSGIYEYLKSLDNTLFSHDEKEDTLIVRTRNIMEENESGNPIDFSILYENFGTSFPRYWFYKLEFVLWHELNGEYRQKWGEYRINSKNSIEHISPQTEKYKEDTVSEDLLHSFGNLALVSRSFNSEMSNDSFREKQATFITKRNSGDIESLKLYLVYENKTWGDTNCNSHCDYMMTILEQYFEKTKTL